MWVLRESVSLGVAGKGSVAEYIHQALSVDVYSCGNLAYSMEFHLKVFVIFLLLFSSLVCRPETLRTSLYLARHLEYGDFCGNFCLTAWLPFDGASTYRSFWNAAWGYYHLPHWGQPKLQTPGQAHAGLQCERMTSRFLSTTSEKGSVFLCWLKSGPAASPWTVLPCSPGVH